MDHTVTQAHRYVVYSEQCTILGHMFMDTYVHSTTGCPMYSVATLKAT